VKLGKSAIVIDDFSTDEIHELCDAQLACHDRTSVYRDLKFKIEVLIKSFSRRHASNCDGRNVLPDIRR
jgi:hypothetical protein